jgi:hypothetical protein
LEAILAELPPSHLLRKIKPISKNGALDSEKIGLKQVEIGLNRYQAIDFQTGKKLKKPKTYLNQQQGPQKGDDLNLSKPIFKPNLKADDIENVDRFNRFRGGYEENKEKEDEILAFIKKAKWY